MGVDSAYFESAKASVRLVIKGSLVRGPLSTSTGELRRSQLGAAFSVAAHFTTNAAPALVSMPTGSGKSAVMTLLPFVLGSTRVLVVTPSTLLREQLATAFLGLRTLRETGAVPAEMLGPRVEVVEHRLDEGGWRALADFDVVVGTVHVLSPGYPNVAHPPPSLFDLVLVDEAHHAAARVYDELLSCFDGTPQVLFSATPFRRDQQPLQAEVVYTYGLGQALADEVLAPVDFYPVDAPQGTSDEEVDLLLAVAAANVLREPDHQRTGSRVIARTQTIEHAKRLVPIYESAGLRMGRIDAFSRANHVRKTLADLRDGRLDGLVSVGVLGEGFDFPTLKVGVYHRRHASLPATLQFLGRISRLVPDGPPGCLLARKEDVSDETRELYASDVAWATLLPALADAAVQAESQRRKYLRGFDPDPTQPLSLSALRPRKDVQVFALREGTKLDLHASLESLGDGDVIYQGADADDRMAVVVTEHLNHPEWVTSDSLDRLRYELHIAVLSRTGRYLFVHGTRDTTINALVEHLGEPEPRLVDPIWLDRLMAGLNLVSYYSIGMRSARAAGGRLAAYRMMAGTNVGPAVSRSETRSYGSGHAIAQAKDPMGSPTDNGNARTTSVGVSFNRAKVFSPDHVHLLDFRAWCDRLADLMEGAAGRSPTGLPGIPLRSPRAIIEFPQHPYLVTLDPALLVKGMLVDGVRSDGPVELERLELTAVRTTPTCLTITASIDGQVAWEGVMDPDGLIKSKNPTVLVRDQGAAEASRMAEFLRHNPPSIFFANGATTIGRALFQAQDDYPELGSGDVMSLPFLQDGVDITKESSTAQTGKKNISTYMIEYYRRQGDIEFIVEDDRAHEVADLVTISSPAPGGLRRVGLVHLKFSSKAYTGARVKDMYEVLGQAGRSVNWMLRPNLLAAQLKRRIEGGSSVQAGDSVKLDELLSQWMVSPRMIASTVTVVQPGLKSSAVTSSEKIKVMLSDVAEWVNQHDVDFKLITSE